MLIGGLVLFLFANRFGNPESKVYPAGQTKAIFEKVFSGRTGIKTVQQQAVYEPHVDPPFKTEGWRFRARITRARALNVLVQKNPAREPHPVEPQTPSSDAESAPAGDTPTHDSEDPHAQ
ncbi:hypothetical protein [Mycobacterium sp. DL592]|uniref:hypothetical protein n=1 Tax=Mycobacterium sp. DL592 TaxID=2675524 RepID=UPI00141E039B|nr:hypothetical protein [Mycobacterium sp. DL592]